ncbi:alpha/beta fold hydrolase [Cellulomonas iranensis]|uniref:alpha/beta fold hydrolase n=1 Tax=Cellulomonas iranensis TaxID=76862 RepID=UPI0015C5897D|nr:alpha/beta hydrolase [Cellulomonas iranensis]
MSASRWLVLPGLACPASSFDAVRRLLPAHVSLDVRANALTATAAQALADGPYHGVVGHSLGGLLALEAALTHPDRVPRVLLLDPTRLHEQGPPAPFRRGLLAVARAVTRAPGAARAAAPVERRVDRWWARRGVVRTAQDRGPEAWRHGVDALAAGWDRAARVDALLATGRPRAEVVLAVPVRGAARERRADGRLAARTGAREVAVRRAGHLLMCDRPDAVAALLVALSDGP